MSTATLSIPKLKRETLPDITPNQLQVSAVYPGASAEEVEKSVVTKIDDSIDGIQFVKEIVSDCREGIGSVTVDLSTGDLKTHCESIKRRLIQVPEVDLVDVRGFSERQIRVELSIEAIRRFGLTVKRVADLVRSQNSDYPRAAWRAINENCYCDSQTNVER